MPVQMVEILLPSAEAGAAKQKVSPRIPSLKGKTIGFIDNGWRSLGIVFDEYTRMLKESEGVAKIIHKKKGASSPTPKAAMEELAQADAVITGLGN